MHTYCIVRDADVVELWRTDTYIKLCECVAMVFQVRNLLKKGLPLKMRPRVWKLFLNSEAPKQQNHFDYQVAFAHTYTYITNMRTTSTYH